MNKFTLEINSELMKIVKSNASVLSIFRKSLNTLYQAYRGKIIDNAEYEIEYSNLLYRCSLMSS
jgi:hypothetical protein